ncbi:MAG TPA: hypothetical protein PLG57_01915 [Bacteroidia bacterium]|nr:hypothetical protein [Bacteroidia bacterium]HQF27446.1 hypothetical protein [Bacteroidia bacterium]HQK96937.1 hypothetical protein [Bacteroidia bacterium]
MRNLPTIIIKAFVLFLVFFHQVNQMKATDLQIIDVFNNKPLSFKQVYKEVKATQVNVFGETQVITYVPENANTAPLKMISDRMLAITNLDWNNEGSFLLLYKEAKNKIGVYLELINSQNYRNDYGENDDENRSIPRLKEVECKPISVKDQLIWYRIEYTFEISSRNRDDQHEVKVNHYYTANTITGEVNQIKNSLNQNSLETVTKKLVPYFTHDYLIRTEKLSAPEIVESEGGEGEYEEDQDENVDRIHHPMQSMLGKDSTEICRDLCEHLNFSEADFYMFGWGIVVEFPKFSRSSKVYGGDAFSIFMPYNKAELLRPYLPAIYFPATGKNISTSIKGFNEKKLIENIGKISNFPSIESIVAQQSGNNKVKSIFINSYQLFNDDKSNYRGQFTIKLDSTGKITERRYENENKVLVSKEFLRYDKLNRLIESNRNGDRYNTESNYYFYDVNDNLLSHFSSDENSTYSEYFFYNNNYVYRINIGNLVVNCDDGIANYVVSGNEITFGGVTYVMDQNNLPSGMRKAKYSYQQFQVGHDDKGRIIESHFENDRRNCYFDYDKENRIVRCQNFEYQNPSIILDYYYSEEQPLPLKNLKRSIQNNILEKEEYSYEYYE